MSTLAYDFLAPAKIVFGWGKRRELGTLAQSLGKHVWLVCGSRSLEDRGTLDEISDSLSAAGLKVVRLSTLRREPQIDDVDQAVAALRGHDACAAGKKRADQGCTDSARQGDVVCAIGGGAAIDLAKAVAALATQAEPGSVLEYLEGVGSGRQLIARPLPVIAVPTTAGTGSEATKNAVISNLKPAYKKSLRHERMVPSVAVVDPELTVSCPATVTAHSGMDAITQLIESFLSCKARPIPSALCLAGLRGVLGCSAADALRRAYHVPEDRQAREVLAQASLFSGMALANSGLGLAHGVAAALGVEAGVPHGLACAVMLPSALRANRSVFPERWLELAPALCGRSFRDPQSAAQGAIECVTSLADELEIPTRLSELGVTAEQLPTLVAGSRGNSMSGNPRPIADDELLELLGEML